MADHLRYAPFTAGETITKQGAVAHWLYILTKGKVEVRLRLADSTESKVVNNIDAPSFFGEMGMLTGAPRRADVIALTDVECYRLDKEGLAAHPQRAARGRRADLAHAGEAGRRVRGRRRGPRRPGAEGPDGPLRVQPADERGGIGPGPPCSFLLRLDLLDALLQLRHHGRVAQRRHVAERAALGDVAQQAAHDLARARLGQVVGPDDPLRPGELADPLGDRLADALDRRLVAVRARPASVTNATIAWPVSSSCWPITAASATSAWATIADSTSAVDSRWPETLTTSSIRPITQK